MQNDMKLPPELRRKWVLLLLLLKMFSLFSLFYCIEIEPFSPPFQLQTCHWWALQSLQRRSIQSNIVYVTKCKAHSDIMSDLCPVSQRVWGDCSQELPWRPAEERWSLWDRQVPDIQCVTLKCPFKCPQVFKRLQGSSGQWGAMLVTLYLYCALFYLG